jgi:2'-5' RNA ligase
MRLFIAVNLPEELKKEIGKFIGELKKTSTPLKWVEQENLHLTLKFLGEVKKEKVPRIIESLKSVGKTEALFELCLQGCGSFGSRVIWIDAVQGTKECCDLAGKIDQSMAALGFTKEERAYTVHLTIGRSKGANRQLLGPLFEVMDKNKDKFFGRWQVTSFELIESTLTPKGPIYKTVEIFPLESNDK